VPPFAGLIEYEPRADGAPSTIAMLQGLVANEGDGWKWTTEEVERYLLQEGLVGNTDKTTNVPLNAACSDAEHAAMAKGVPLKFQS